MMSDDEWLCPICHRSVYEKVGGGSGGGGPCDRHQCTIAPCGHIFHSYCIKEWLQASPCLLTILSTGPCPICQENISEENLVPVDLPARDSDNANDVTDEPEQPPDQNQDNPEECPYPPQCELLPEPPCEGDMARQDKETQRREMIDLLPSHPLFMALFWLLLLAELWSIWSGDNGQS